MERYVCRMEEWTRRDEQEWGGEMRTSVRRARTWAQKCEYTCAQKSEDICAQKSEDMGAHMCTEGRGHVQRQVHAQA